MAYSKTPEISTYQTKDIPFHGVDARRDFGSGSDIGMLNCYYDRHSQENKERDVWIRRRPGFQLAGITGNLPTGAYYSSVSNNSLNSATFCAETGTTNNWNITVLTDQGFIRTLSGITSSKYGHGIYGCEFLYNNGTVELNFITGNTQLRIAPNLLTPFTVSTLPFNAINWSVSIDGYIFTAEANTNKIRSCALNTPTDWTTISDPQLAESSSDSIVALANVGNYLVAFGFYSTEFFYNAGVAAPEFPFRRQAGYTQSVGYSSQLAQAGDTLYFIGNEKGAGLGVFKLENFKIERISTPAMERRLVISTVTEGNIIKANGKSWYAVKNNFETWVYDLEEHLWSVWVSAEDNALPIAASTTVNYAGVSYCIDTTDGKIVSFSSVSDRGAFGGGFPVVYRTEIIDFESDNWKTINRLFLKTRYDAEQVGNPAFKMRIRWSDDNGVTWSTHRDYFPTSPSPFINRCGRFRRRIFEIFYDAPYPVSWQGLRVDVNLGVN